MQPRFAGVASLMRLPQLALDDARFAQLDIGLVGVPWDGGINPFALCNCADLGDTPVNPVDLMDSLTRIQAFFDHLHAAKVAPLSIGGDHLVSLPILRALGKNGPVGMVHFDAHTDTWGQEQGIRVIDIDEFHRLGIDAVIAEARRVTGDGPTYVSFDVDALDPVYAPGTGTPEIGGLTTLEAQRLLRGLQGLNLVGGDVVEVSPPFDTSGNTALAAATLAFEILCVLAHSVHARMKP